MHVERKLTESGFFCSSFRPKPECSSFAHRSAATPATLQQADHVERKLTESGFFLLVIPAEAGIQLFARRSAATPATLQQADQAARQVIACTSSQK
jgi:hypothetical protein